MSAARIMAAIHRRPKSEGWSDAFQLEIQLRDGPKVVLEHHKTEAEYLVMRDEAEPEGFQDVYIPFDAILTVRPIWR